jgi:hypothetical protein
VHTGTTTRYAYIECVIFKIESETTSTFWYLKCVSSVSVYMDFARS